MSILEKVQPIETMLPERYHKMSKEDMEKRVHEIKRKNGKNVIHSRTSLPKR
ncbi:Quinolinate synthetase A [Bacillus thuringiensis serovar sotto str. T04001]|nr:Quinolinate synthetase A [Bacillus thuringiensis serovar sotto str. T04001]